MEKPGAMKRVSIVSALLFGKWTVESGFPEAGSSANIVSIASSNIKKTLISNKVEDEE